ncbi:MAG: FKBP-type peptidyl-prolyl cis-trans isomerase [Bacteroidota bacterium]
MKKLVIAIVFLFSLNGFAQKTPVAGGNSALPVKLNSGIDTMQYVLGAYLGQYISNNGFVISNATLFKKGLEDALNGKPLSVNADSILPMMNKYEKLGGKERNSQQEKLLFEKIKGQPGMGVLPSGVCYAIVKVATGSRPQPTDSVEMHLKGFLADGRQFEDTYPKNTPYKTSPDNVIAGMKEILQIMPAGSVWRVYIPSAMAFGEKGLTGLIPPYAALIYEVELLKVTANPKKQEGK